MTKSSPKKKSTKRDNRRPVDILAADCRALAQRLETLVFTMHAQQRAAREALDDMVLASKSPSLQEQARIDALVDVHSVARRTSSDSSDLAAALRRGADEVVENVNTLISAAQQAEPDFPTEKF